MEITLNLVSPEIQRRRRLYHLGVGGLCVGLLLGIGNVFLYRSSSTDLRIAEQQLQRYQEALRTREQSLAGLSARLTPRQVETLGARVKLYNRIIQGATFSWSQLLFELERTIPRNVALVEIQPKFGEGEVILTGSAKTMEDLLLCVRRLKERDAFHHVYLLEHQVEKNPTGDGRMEFTISLRYRGEAV
jgi:Tfp pilus assembly protein PilN